MNLPTALLFHKSKIGRMIVFGVLSFIVGCILIIFAFFINIGSVFTAIILDDTFYFPTIHTTVPSEPYDPNRVIVHEYEIVVDVPILDKDGQPMQDAHGNMMTQPEKQIVREEIPSPHLGIDFDLPESTYVVASRTGMVQSVYENSEDGKTVVIQYEDGWQTIYKHLSNVIVSSGQEVLLGQPVGQVGMTGSCTPYDPNHTFNLHFEMKNSSGHYIDPMTKLEQWREYIDFPIEMVKAVAEDEWEDWTGSEVPPYVDWDGTHFVWPVPGYTRLSSDYGYRTLNGVYKLHKGIDISAPQGTPIYAAASGVISTKVHSSYGIAVKISVDGNMVNIYGHMIARAPGIMDGVTVQAGQLIGYVGSTGQSTGNHLHFEVRIDNQPTDPKPFFRKNSNI